VVGEDVPEVVQADSDREESLMADAGENSSGFVPATDEADR
jgi:hypothetical protein